MRKSRHRKVRNKCTSTLQQLLPVMRVVPAVTLLHVAGFHILVKLLWQLFAVFSTSGHHYQLQLSQVTFIVSPMIILPINQHYVDTNQTMTLPLIWTRPKQQLHLASAHSYTAWIPYQSLIYGLEMSKYYIDLGKSYIVLKQTKTLVNFKGWPFTFPLMFTLSVTRLSELPT